MQRHDSPRAIGGRHIGQIDPDQLGRAAADIHHQAFFFAGRQTVRGADINQPGFFAPGDDFNRKSQTRLCFADEGGGVFCHPQGVGAHHPHLVGAEVAQTVAKPRQAGQRALLGGVVQKIVSSQASAQAHGVFEGVERKKLLAIDADDLQTKAIGAEINGGKGFKRGRHQKTSGQDG